MSKPIELTSETVTDRILSRTFSLVDMLLEKKVYEIGTL